MACAVSAIAGTRASRVSRFANLRRGAEAIHFGHLPVGDNDREISELQVGPRLAPVLGLSHFVAEALEHGAQCEARDSVVFGEEKIHWSAPGRIRTSDQQLRRLLLYPPELRARARTAHNLMKSRRNALVHFEAIS